MNQEDIETMKRQYEQMSAPPELEQRILEATVLASRSRRRGPWPFIARTAASTAVLAAMALFLVCWTNPALAASLSDVPVLGVIVRIASGQSYEKTVQGSQISIKAPRVEIDGQPALADQVNGEIDSYLSGLKSEYEEVVEFAAGQDPHLDVESDYQVMTNDSRVFSLVLTTYHIAGSGGTERRCYTLDKETGRLLQLKDLFLPDSDYVSVISAEIIRQMNQTIEADSDKAYFIGDTAVEPFETIGASQQFYIDQTGRLVICFDKYEVAPGYMGAQSFVIPYETLEPILAENSPLRSESQIAVAIAR